MSEPTGALWVYAIKNVNICRRLVIGCKYGGGRVRGPVLGPDGAGWASQLLCFVIYWNAWPRARAAPKPTLPDEAPRGRAQ